MTEETSDWSKNNRQRLQSRASRSNRRLFQRYRPDRKSDLADQDPTGRKTARSYSLTHPHKSDILRCVFGTWDRMQFDQLKRRELAAPSWVVTASKRCFEYDAGS